MSAIYQATADAYDDCIEVARDFTGQGVLIMALLIKHKARALAALGGPD